MGFIGKLNPPPFTSGTMPFDCFARRMRPNVLSATPIIDRAEERFNCVVLAERSCGSLGVGVLTRGLAGQLASLSARPLRHGPFLRFDSETSRQLAAAGFRTARTELRAIARPSSMGFLATSPRPRWLPPLTSVDLCLLRLHSPPHLPGRDGHVRIPKERLPPRRVCSARALASSEVTES